MARNSGAEHFECRFCGCRVSKVTDTRSTTMTVYGKKHTFIKRRRVCHHCKLPFTTVERILEDDEPTTTTTPAPFPPPVVPSPKKIQRQRKGPKNPYL